MEDETSTSHFLDRERAGYTQAPISLWRYWRVTNGPHLAPV